MSGRPPPNSRNFPEASWRDQFTSRALRRGRTLEGLGAVRRLSWHAHSFSATAAVLEPNRPAYVVDVCLDWYKSGWDIDSVDCTCPSGGSCAHIAATLVALSKNALADENANANKLPEALRSWLGQIRVAAEPKAEPSPATSAAERVLYVLKPETANDFVSALPTLQCLRSRKRANGTEGKSSEFTFLRALQDSPPAYVQAADIEIARHLHLIVPRLAHAAHEAIRLAGPHASGILRAILETGRCYWLDHSSSSPLRLGPARKGEPNWQRNTRGQLRAAFSLTPPAEHLLALDSAWYLDPGSSECGPIDCSLAPYLIQTWLRAPALDPLVAATHIEVLSEQFQAMSLPIPSTVPVNRPIGIVPTPTLFLDTENVPWWEAPWAYRDAGSDARPVLAARAAFLYADQSVSSADGATEIRVFRDNELTLIPRDRAFEQRAEEGLKALGLVRGTKAYPMSSSENLRNSWTLENRTDEALVEFITRLIPTLKEQGWQVERAPDFALEVCQPSEWFFETQPEGSDNSVDWFGIELGVRLGDERINLLPVLLETLRRGPDWIQPEVLQKKGSHETVLVQIPDGRRIPFPAGRLRDILATLIELHSPETDALAGRIRVHRLRAAQLGELADSPNWTWSGADSLRDLADRLRKMEGLPEVESPGALRATLRPYQTDGLRWLQFIREFQLGGILADDMGLGKTVQTIAHLLLEKEEGRLDRPALVVSPTSVLVNWRDELARFAPDLKILTLHGSDRHGRFAEMQQAEVVLTTYALLPRDADELLAARFHCVILDEAQNIKNPKTQAARVVCQLQAQHRLCLSGTPVENHLGELWSLFNFLVPGFLGDETRFRAVFRQPIEKENDVSRRKHLARRVRPFLLRRRKDDVARELPEKTEILRKIELVGQQRDLYETIRLAMETRVRDEVRKKGVQRSHIVILDALLKLRQTCCDPRLVPLEAARNITDSAKLDHLLELLPTLLEDGRRILLFSQFTSMLALIQQRLDDAKIPWLLLTGDTDDRATPVRRFQAGDVPLFLLSLKAGGSGLNLTAADTVILFDPWWNPAVEAQAIDRAHRIGQEKPVFVYRLIAAGTVEEKMVELQTRKRELVQALLEDGPRGSLQLAKEDIDLLFAPIG